ncbi:DUF2789 domain-containing protein [Propionivibrio limicola]|uniref:DUF2789 domain-containing protein n=1 Tax=Propionivibrio limicola TaxID=167645 RepID=UPI0012920D5D|nr:DUF2789 domain-containing protein [Propionivibrio limicola]
MESPIHVLSDLFRQLGLPDDESNIENFIATHRPLPGQISLADAPFWNASQAQFLREEIAENADWAELIDTFDTRLRG